MSVIPETALRKPLMHPDRRTFLSGLAALPFLPTAAQAAPVLTVETTTAMIADAVRTIGAGRVTAGALIGSGIDPHSYRQTRSDIVRLLAADMVLWHGLWLEAQLAGFLAELGARKPVHAVAEALAPDLLLAHDAYPDRFDPHVWMDPALWSLVVAEIARLLDAADPEGAGARAGATARHQEEIAALGRYAAEVLDTVPPAARVLVTAHDAFRYFGRAYGFEVMGLQGVSTESEAGLNRVGELVEVLAGRGIGAVFVESSVPERAVQALIEGAAARGHAVALGGTLFSDAMGPEGSYEGTWIGMIDHNVTTIARALGGQAPEGGHRGLLAGAA